MKIFDKIVFDTHIAELIKFKYSVSQNLLRAIQRGLIDCQHADSILKLKF